MKFVINQEKLLEGLYNTSRAISPRNLIPILAGIKFDLKEEGLYLSASDTDISIRCLIEAKDIKEISAYGSIVIGGKYIVEIIKKLPNTDISIEVVDGYKMIVSTSNTEFSLNGINPNEFPNLDLEESKNPIVLRSSILKNIVSQTFFATSQNESRPILTGINFKFNNGILEAVATDSYRLSKKDVKLENFDNIDEMDIIIPGKNLLELTKIMIDDNCDLFIHIFDNKILFKYKNILFLSRLLSGKYPATSSVIPTDFNVKVECNCIDLYNMIDRASLLTSDRDKNIIKLELNNNNLIISSNSPEIGNVEEKMVVESSDSISISFSSKYMLDSIKSFGTNNITLCMNNENSPIVIKSKDDDSIIQLVSPIKTY